MRAEIALITIPDQGFKDGTTFIIVIVIALAIVWLVDKK